MPLLSPAQVGTAVLADEYGIPAVVTCPMCHTPASLTQSDLDAGGGWRCSRCGQRWSAMRLSTVAAYAAAFAERADVGAATGETMAPAGLVPPQQRSRKP